MKISKKIKIQVNNKQAEKLWEVMIYDFIKKLKYKSVLYGKEFKLINESYTSKTCSGCGNIKSISLSQRRYKCSCCGFEEDRDYNSAVNILKRFIAQFGLPATKVVGNYASA